MVCRQQKGWAGSFPEDEEGISRRVWELLRCGRLAAAQEFCVSVGRPWQAATLGSLAGDIMYLTP